MTYNTTTKNKNACICVCKNGKCKICFENNSLHRFFVIFSWFSGRNRRYDRRYASDFKINRVKEKHTTKIGNKEGKEQVFSSKQMILYVMKQIISNSPTKNAKIWQESSGRRLFFQYAYFHRLHKILHDFYVFDHIIASYNLSLRNWYR